MFCFRVLSTVVAASLVCLSYVLPAPACCSLFPARFSGTVVYAGEAEKDGVLVHVLGYQNTVDNRNSSGGGGNAMLLPIPAKAGTMSASNILDTRKCKHILEDMKDFVLNKHASRRISLGALTKSNAMPEPLVFDHDIYTIVLAQDAKAIPGALSRVPEEKRPALNNEIFKAYSKWYPGYTFALCCFNTKDEAKAFPMLWWYEPSEPDQLFCPALDAHDGKPPRLGVQVDVDHVVVAGSHKIEPPRAERAAETDEMKEFALNDVSVVKYTDQAMPTDVRKLLPRCIVGGLETGMRKNGDFVFATKDVRSGVLKVIRKDPPGARK